MQLNLILNLPAIGLKSHAPTVVKTFVSSIAGHSCCRRSSLTLPFSITTGCCPYHTRPYYWWPNTITANNSFAATTTSTTATVCDNKDYDHQSGHQLDSRLVSMSHKFRHKVMANWFRQNISNNFNNNSITGSSVSDNVIKRRLTSYSSGDTKQRQQQPPEEQRDTSDGDHSSRHDQTATATDSSGGGYSTGSDTTTDFTSDDDDLFEEPPRVRFGLLKVTITIALGLYAGALFAMFGANFLEEYEIFVTGDDEDDD
ncbi:uncharacterized protein LOC128954793 [Oppia nitens]|uniref:uncharacterized protein LOC128954793 n=1 Tax=Oppia nitens TaxID=1686743 RepID=UPI0023DBFA53|nr:uncharacterized protein LOC128954793 [Oppia nitens]